jgi:4-hydroxyphenylpyruvate dioxygenase-like putative hemolysin
MSIAVKFHHIQFYVDNLKSLDEYKSYEKVFTTFSNSIEKAGETIDHDIEANRKIFQETIGATSLDSRSPAEYDSKNQDMVKQLIGVMGFRITGHHCDSDTESVLLTTCDSAGTKFVVTTTSGGGKPAAKRARQSDECTPLDHFSKASPERFYKSQSGRQGVGVLAFEVEEKGGVEAVAAAYKAKHPKLLAHGGVQTYPGDSDDDYFKVLDVAAYYQYTANGELVGDRTGEADTGTVIRFVERGGQNFRAEFLPGLVPIEATFDRNSLPAYSDHWVSNVFNRTEFLDTLNECLGFTPKVDFNAGVVAAGEAQIESTVTGNTSGVQVVHAEDALVLNSQVYLPINNAMSKVGHVHLYLQEIGQGIQHIASRVGDLPRLIQRANDYREMTGEGFTFLNIPRSYYGSLCVEDIGTATSLSAEDSQLVFDALFEAKLVDTVGIAQMDVTAAQVAAALKGKLPTLNAKKKKALGVTVLKSRFCNLYKVLGDHIDEEAYLKIVRNKILVDIQGDDVLYQIFTSCVLQREAGQEAPFLEFIQRVCSSKKDEATGKCKPIRPGCGGFGIRNFLTLFLSIEVLCTPTVHSYCARILYTVRLDCTPTVYCTLYA